MIELVQISWSPFCQVQRRILDYAGARFDLTDIPCQDRSLVWRLTRQRYYSVPILRDGHAVVFETDEDSQVIAKYLDAKLRLDLFPKEFRGVDRILWKFVEDQIEGACFRLNDIYWQEFVPEADQLSFLRHKERKFGRGCLDQWRAQQPALLADLTQKLMPFECMLADRPFLLRTEPHFIDFDLWGMLACFLHSGHYQMPSVHTNLLDWHGRMSHLKKAYAHSEKLHT
jgi:glutathione S-transferase